MEKISFKLFLLLLLAGIFTSCQNKISSTRNSTPKEEVTNYSGEWESVSAEDLGNGTYATRYFKLDNNEWTVHFKLYLDSTLHTPVFQFTGIGKYELQGKSTIIKGADNALFGFDHKYLTLLTDDQNLINNFGFAACSLEKGIEKDITEEGCSFLVSKTVCAQEYDVLKLENNLLYFGMRPSEGDMCAEDRRPTALFYPLKRK